MGGGIAIRHTNPHPTIYTYMFCIRRERRRWVMITTILVAAFFSEYVGAERVDSEVGGDRQRGRSIYILRERRK